MQTGMDEFLSLVKSRGATIWVPADARAITLTNSGLQMRRCAVLPRPMLDLYAVAGGANLGAGYIFGPAQIQRTGAYPVPSITEINTQLTGIEAARGKTVFGRNDLFWFAFDAFGAFYMLDNLTLAPLRKYDDPFRAMADCLIGGKF